MATTTVMFHEHLLRSARGGAGPKESGGGITAHSRGYVLGAAVPKVSGSDIRCQIGQYSFAELQAVSYSVTREKAPIYTLKAVDMGAAWRSQCRPQLPSSEPTATAMPSWTSSTSSAASSWPSREDSLLGSISLVAPGASRRKKNLCRARPRPATRLPGRTVWAAGRDGGGRSCRWRLRPETGKPTRLGCMAAGPVVEEESFAAETGDGCPGASSLRPGPWQCGLGSG